MTYNIRPKITLNTKLLSLNKFTEKYQRHPRNFCALSYALVVLTLEPKVNIHNSRSQGVGTVLLIASRSQASVSFFML